MARRISSLTPRGRYPWLRWTDGSTWRIRRGEDFEIPAANMAAVVRARAVRDGLAVVTRVVDDAVEFRFEPVAAEAAVADESEERAA